MFSSHKLEHLGIYIYSLLLSSEPSYKEEIQEYYLMLRTKGGGS